MAASRPINTVIAGRIIYFFNAFVIPRNLGYVTVPDGGFKLASGTVRQPDVGFVSKVCAPHLPDEFDFAPDLAVEVVSPNEDVLKKVNEYLRSGCRMVWAIYADDRRVYVFTDLVGESSPHPQSRAMNGDPDRRFAARRGTSKAFFSPSPSVSVREKGPGDEGQNALKSIDQQHPLHWTPTAIC